MTSVPRLSNNPFSHAKLSFRSQDKAPELTTAPEVKPSFSTAGKSDEAAQVNIGKSVELPTLTSYSSKPTLSTSGNSGGKKKINSDFDGDGFVTGQDFDSFTQAFEKGDKSTDVNGDGRIDAADKEAFVKEFENPTK